MGSSFMEMLITQTMCFLWRMVMTPPEGKPGCVIQSSEMEHNDLISGIAWLLNPYLGNLWIVHLTEVLCDKILLRQAGMLIIRQTS